ncbi:MAG: ABC transporter ATP-binding protein [Halobacteriaceae archaeon]
MNDRPSKTATDQDIVLQVSNLTKEFATVTALRNISFDVHRGNIIAVIGPNGSGKTTLVEIIAGLKEQTEGEVHIPTNNAGRTFGYLMQNPEFRPEFTVKETVEFYANLLPIDPDVDSYIERVGLTTVKNRKISALSGGMKQLTGLAQSLLGSPPLVIVDEPTVGLDPRMTNQIFSVIADVTDAGQTVLITTHDMAHASIADRLLLLHRGELVADTSPASLLEQTDTDSIVDGYIAIVGEEPTVQSGEQ